MTCVMADERGKKKKRLAPIFNSDVNIVLKDVFGHNSFRSSLQENAVKAVMKGTLFRDQSLLLYCWSLEMTARWHNT